MHRACFHFDLKIKMTAMIVIMMSTIMMMIIGGEDNDVPRGRSRHKEVPVCCFARSGGDETRGRLSLRLDQPSTHLFDTVLLSQLGDDYLPKALSNLLGEQNQTYSGKSVKNIFLGPITEEFPFGNRESCCQNQSGRKIVSVAAALRAEQGP